MAPKRFEIEIERPIAQVFDYLVERTADLWTDEGEERERFAREVSRSAFEAWHKIEFATHNGRVTYEVDRSISAEATPKKGSRFFAALRVETRGAGTLVT